MKNLIFTQNLLCSILTVLLLMFSLHGVANAQGTLAISPASITGQSGDEYRITVTAQDENGDPVSDVVIEFSVSEPSGLFLHASGVTDDDGTVENIFTLPIRNAVVYATATGYQTAFMRVRVISEPHKLVIVSGDNQEGVTGTELPLRFVVRVEDIDSYALPGQLVTFSIISGEGDLAITAFRTDSHGEAWTILTLGDIPGDNVVEVNVGDVPPMRFRATAIAIAEKLITSSGIGQTGFPNKPLAVPLVVKAVDRNGYGVHGVKVTFKVTEGSGRVSPSSMLTDDDGFATTDFIPNAPGTVIVEASAEALSPVTFTVQIDDPPDKILSVSGSNQNGAPGTQLTEPFVVEVRDINAEPVAGVVVTFAVTTGGGSVSATTDTTDANGQAQTYLRLGSLYGVNTVKASVSGVLTQATFEATSQEQVLVAPTAHPSMYWINTSANTVHRLVEGKVETLISSSQNITGLAVDTTNGFLYFAVKTGKNSGEIRRSELTGRNPQTIRSGLTSIVDIAVDSSGGKIYWTSASGRIKSMATEGSKRVTDIVRDLFKPTSLVVSNGYLYWTEPLGRIRRMNLTADQKTPMDIATGLVKPRGIAIAKGKVYWIEHFGGGSGRLRRANLNGTKIEELRTFTRNVPIGIAIDDLDNKIYWTRSTGKIQRANLMGRSITDIVTGLMRPGAIALDRTLPDAEPVVEQKTPTTKTTTKTDSPYDVNDDGRVDIEDVKLVIDALGTDNLDYDVNADDKINLDDLLLVFNNRDNDAAGAPSVGSTAVQVDRIRAQIEMLLASGDTSLVAQQVLMYLQHLLASARPDETVLVGELSESVQPGDVDPVSLGE